MENKKEYTREDLDIIHRSSFKDGYDAGMREAWKTIKPLQELLEQLQKQIVL